MPPPTAAAAAAVGPSDVGVYRSNRRNASRSQFLSVAWSVGASTSGGGSVYGGRRVDEFDCEQQRQRHSLRCSGRGRSLRTTKESIAPARR